MPPEATPSAEGAPAPVETVAPVTETPVEGALAAAAVVEGEPAAVVEKTAEELAAEVEAKKVEDAKFAADLPELLKKIPEAELRKLGLQHANRTMAAARRAERAVEAVTRENATLKAQLAAGGSAPSLRKDPAAALKAEGFASVRDFIDHMVSTAGGEPKPADPIDEVGKLRKEIEAEKAAIAAERAAQVVEASKAAVANAIKADAARWGRTATPTGQSRLWGEIVAYHKEHGSCPDNAVHYLADQVERELRAEFGEPAPRPAAKGASATGAAGPAASSDGKTAATITSKGSGGAPVVREYSQDPDERRRQITKELIAEGLLQASTG